MADRYSIEQMLADARSTLKRLEPEAAYEAVQNGAVLIDTRSPDAIARDGAVPGALQIPLSVLEWRMDPGSEWRYGVDVDLDDHVVVICAHGQSSGLAAARLQQVGFARATDVIGGFEAWEAAGLPVER